MEESIEDLPNLETLNINNVSINSRFSAFKSPTKKATRDLGNNQPGPSNISKTTQSSGLSDHAHMSHSTEGVDNKSNPIKTSVQFDPLPQRITKRKRNQSAELNNTSSSDSVESTSSKPADKKHKQNSNTNTKHVSFSLQNNPDPDPENVVAAPAEDYEIISEAAPIWRSALSHRTHENRANLRSSMYKEFIDGDTNPMWTYGIERIPDYLKPLSTTMMAKLHSNAKALTQLAYMELLARATTEKQLANNHEGITKTLYTEADNPDFNKAMNRSAGILSAYRAQEIRKVTAYKIRETTNRPTTEKEWRQALETKPRPPSQDRSRAPKRGGGNKRRRSNTRSPAPTRGPSPGPSNRGRGRGRGRGGYRNRNDRMSSIAANNDKEAALFSALRAFIK